MNKNRVIATLCSASMTFSCGNYLPVSHCNDLTAYAASKINMSDSTATKNKSYEKKKVSPNITTVKADNKIAATTTVTDTTIETYTTYYQTTLNNYEVSKVYVDLDTNEGFYYNSDEEFDSDQLNTVILHIVYEEGFIYSNGMKEIISSKEDTIDIKNKVSFGNANPANTYNKENTDFKYKIPLYCNEDISDKNGKIIVTKGSALCDIDGKPANVTAYIGIKGDVTLDNNVDLRDAMAISNYYSKLSIGQNTDVSLSPNKELTNEVPEFIYEDFAAFLGNVHDHNMFRFAKKSNQVFDFSDSMEIQKYYSLASVLTPSYYDSEQLWNIIENNETIDSGTSNLKWRTADLDNDYDTGSLNVLDSDAKPILSVSKLLYDNVNEAAGQTVKVTISLSGADKKYTYSGFHVYWDDRLTLATEEMKNNTLECVTPEEAISEQKIMAQPVGRKGVFLNAYSYNNTKGFDGDMWSLYLNVPSDAQNGDVYPIDIVYENCEQVHDCFTSDDPYTEESKLMQAYLFTKGINSKSNPSDDPILIKANAAYADGYIAFREEAATTSTSTYITTSTTSANTTTTITKETTAAATSKEIAATTYTATTSAASATTASSPLVFDINELSLINGGQYNINADRNDLTYKSNNTDVAVVSPSGIITAVGTGSAIISIMTTNYDVFQITVNVDKATTTADTGATEIVTTPVKSTDKIFGDINGDGTIDGRDATVLLTYYSRTSTGYSGTLEEFIKNPPTPQTKTTTQTTTTTTTTTITSETTTTTVETTTTTSTTTTAAETTTETTVTAYSDAWKTYYLTAAEAFEAENENSTFKLIDFNSDSIPELYARSKHDSGCIWTVVNNELKQVHEWASGMIYSPIKYDENKHIIFTNSSSGETYYDYDFFELKNDGTLLHDKTVSQHDTIFTVNGLGVNEAYFKSFLEAETADYKLLSETNDDMSFSKLSSVLTGEPEIKKSIWRQLYINAAKEFESNTSGSTFQLIDINKDGIPELYAINQHDAGILWTITDDKLITLHKWEGTRSSGIVGINPDRGTYLSYTSSNYNNFGYALWELSENGFPTRLKTYVCTNGQYYINGQSVSESDFDAAIKSDFGGNTSNEEIYDLTYSDLVIALSETSDSSATEEQINEALNRTLAKFKSDHSMSGNNPASNTKYCLIDADSDGNPELFISGMRLSGHITNELYVYRGGEFYNTDIHAESFSVDKTNKTIMTYVNSGAEIYWLYVPREISITPDEKVTLWKKNDEIRKYLNEYTRMEKTITQSEYESLAAEFNSMPWCSLDYIDF